MVTFHPGYPVGPRSWRQAAVPLVDGSSTVIPGAIRNPTGQEHHELHDGFKILELRGAAGNRLLAARSEDLARVDAAAASAERHADDDDNT